MSIRCVQALGIAAEWRGILSREQVERMLEHLAQQNISNPAELRAWITSAPGLSADLGRRLLGCLAVEKWCVAREFGQWTPIAVLEESGVKALFLAHTSDGTWVLIKTLGTAAGRGREFQDRFAREIDIMHTIRHANVQGYLGSGTSADDKAYLVLEYVPCGNLCELISRGTVDLRLALTIVRKIVDVLELMGSNGLVHRDIKPSNVYASTEGYTKLGDFGTARSTAADRLELTVQGSILVAPQYAAPEQNTIAGTVDVRTDLFSCGGILYYLLVGEDPYTGKMHEIMHAQAQGIIPSVVKRRADIPVAVDAIVQRAMVQDIHARYPNAAAMRDALDAVLESVGGLLGESGTNEASAILSSTAAAGIEKEFATMISSPGIARSAPATQPSAEMHDIQQGAQCDWLCLHADAGAGQIMLFARTQLLAGKKREAPVDVCLRNYPLAERMTDCAKISRRHLVCAYDPHLGGCTVTDLGGVNGTSLNGQPMAANQGIALTPQQHYRLTLAGILELDIQSIPRRNPPVQQLAGCTLSPTGAACGLSADYAIDALTFIRPRNATNRSMALVLRSVRIGATGADLPVTTASNAQELEIAQFAGHWIWRTIKDANGARITHAPTAGWQPLSIGQKIHCAGNSYTVRAGTYEDFDDA